MVNKFSDENGQWILTKDQIIFCPFCASSDLVEYEDKTVKRCNDCSNAPFKVAFWDERQ